jgi:predicted secreted protein
MGTLSKSLAVLLVLTAASAIILIGSSTVPILPKGSQVWSETFGGAGDEWAFSVIQTSDGGYAIAGYTDSFGAGKMDFWLVKTDSFGSQEWNKTYGGAGYDWASSVIQTSDGGYVIAGSTNSSGEWGYDFWLVKTDSSGNQQWNKTYGGTNHDYASSVVQTIDGGYALAGIANSFGDGGYAFSGFRDVFIVGNADAWLVKTDSFGNQLWNKTFGEFHDDGAFSVVQTSDGGYALTGNTYSFSAGNNTDVWLIKTDSSGNKVWNKTFGGPKDDFGYFVIQTSDGGYALAGITNSSGAGYEDVWLIKTDASGNVIWNKTYGGTLNDEAYFVMQTKDEGYALAGATYALNAGLWDAWLIKTDSSGNILWTQVHGGVGDDQAISLVLTSEGEFVLTGSTNTFGAGGWDTWLFKVMGTDVSSANQSPAPNSP